MPSELFDQFFKEGLISRESLEKINSQWLQPVVSLRKDLKVLLYVGVLLLSSGLSILVYKNIDSIGHIAILCFIAIVCIFCYAYCFKKASPFSWEKAESPDSLFDYLLVLGGLTMLTFTGYLQYQYQVFGETWNLAAFIPMVALFITAYYFDHTGILSMAIASLAAWLGITINRVKWPFLVNLHENQTIYTAIVLGIFLVGMAWISQYSKLKPHFKFFYHQFGTHIFFISSIIAIFQFEPHYWPWLFLVLAGSSYHIIKAYFETSFYYLVVAILYAYIGISFMVTEILKHPGESSQMIFQRNLIYFIISSAGLAWLLVRLNNKFKQHAGV